LFSVPFSFLWLAQVDELKARLLHVKQIEEERMYEPTHLFDSRPAALLIFAACNRAALETLKQELEQQEREESRYVHCMVV
jgi:hypothetical protein